ncbi:DUF2642 domain-containing protein [Virgibacillus sp. NKC19-16]|uniref:DUF2642 domain-containing protein n=1 Tax=Virgibacillus salidurans TaxID=2831673 RepID=UPI001F47F504|nr:DUF2642 domain-containing protein [Virgibacillus sp. NKC19-16]UJL46875.1 DUF2642 domain-containing protein [Virgibacillus sp. NKC19-16]
MANLTNGQRSNVLRLINQLSQNINTNNSSGLSENLSINLPGFNVDAGLNLGFGSGDDGTVTPPPNTLPPTTPTTIREVLLNLVNEQVEVSVPFGTVTGTLLLVRDDYVVIVEASGAQVLVRIENIETVSEL